MMAVMKDDAGDEKLSGASGVKIQVEITPMMLPVFKVKKCYTVCYTLL